MSCFAYYRLPYSDSYVKIESDEGPLVFSDMEKACNMSGFVIAPFSKGNVVLITADRITKGLLPNRETLDWKQEIENIAVEPYQEAFEKFHDAVCDGSFGKLVLARKKEVGINADMDLYGLFSDACRLFPRLMIMLFHTEITGTWLIASPEILLESSGGNHHTVALAGTMPFREGYSSWSEKNKTEQHIVEDYISGALSSICYDILLDGPVSMRAGHLQHLRTDFRFKGSTIGKIVSVLHPTPAVSGFPREEAIDFILRNENLDRKYYSGFSGPVNLDGETHLYVSLRCAEIDLEHKKAILYAGGGIMPDSDCNSEWLETEQKMSTISCIVTRKI